MKETENKGIREKSLVLIQLMIIVFATCIMIGQTEWRL